MPKASTSPVMPWKAISEQHHALLSTGRTHSEIEFLQRMRWKFQDVFNSVMTSADSDETRELIELAAKCAFSIGRLSSQLHDPDYDMDTAVPGSVDWQKT